MVSTEVFKLQFQSKGISRVRQCSSQPRAQLGSTASPDIPSRQDSPVSLLLPCGMMLDASAPCGPQKWSRGTRSPLWSPALAKVDALNGTHPQHPALLPGRLSLPFSSQLALLDQGSPRANLITANYCKREQKSSGTCPSALYSC